AISQLTLIALGAI
ncbi:hypothetical protein MK338_03340, partial [Streptococcus vestibularis]|nr:hypothetical protein [Streptococcus vestibularis]